MPRTASTIEITATKCSRSVVPADISPENARLVCLALALSLFLLLRDAHYIY